MIKQRMKYKQQIKTVLVITEGDRARGRPARRWYHDITDWCGTLPGAVHVQLALDMIRSIIRIVTYEFW